MNIVIENWNPTEREHLANCFKIYMDGVEVYPRVLFYASRYEGDISYIELRWRLEVCWLDKLHSKVRQTLAELGCEWGDWTAVKRDGPHAGTVFACVEVSNIEDKKEKTCCEEAAQKGQPWCECEVPF